MQEAQKYFSFGAGDGNRTHNISLEGWSFTTKLHPHKFYFGIIAQHFNFGNIFLNFLPN